MRLKRITYIDNLRIFLIGLVVLHHLSITYGAPGGWYYFEGQAGPIASVILTLFVAANQSFFMGLLFFISAYFTNSSYRKNDAKLFLQKRIIRLGIPWFSFILSFLQLQNIFRFYSMPSQKFPLANFLLVKRDLGLVRFGLSKHFLRSHLYSQHIAQSQSRVRMR